MDERQTDTPEQVLKFAPKHKGHDHGSPLDEAGKAILTQIQIAADLASEDCDRAMSLHINFPWNSERPKIECMSCRRRLTSGATERPAPNNGFE
jgi:hypothetical protein